MPHKLIVIFLLFVLHGLWPSLLIAQQPADIHNQAILTNRLYIEDQRNRNEAIQVPTYFPIEPMGPVEPSDEQLRQFTVSSIIVEQETQLPDRIKRSIIARYLNTPLSITDINQLTRDLTNAYIQLGYITTRVYVGQNQDLTTGVLRLVAVEGRVQDIVYTYSSRPRPLWNLTAFPNSRGSVLNLRDIEQGIDQISRLQSRRPQINFLPGNIQGQTIIEISDQPSNPIHGSLSYDNYSRNQVSLYPHQLSVTYDDCLGLHDQLFLQFYTNNDQLGQNNTSVYSSLSIPFSYFTLSLSHSDFNYSYRIPQVSGILTQTGGTRSSSAQIDMVLYRSQLSKGVFNGSLRSRREFSHQNSVQIDSQTLTATIAGVGFTHSLFTRWGMISLGSAYAKGISMFDAEYHPFGSANEPSIFFEKIELRGSITGRGTVIRWPGLYSLTAIAQRTNQTVFPSDRLSIGGPFTVRGFASDQAQNGENGYYFKNELSFRLPDLIQATQSNATLAAISPYFALDAGFVQSTDPTATNPSTGLVGGGVGLRYQRQSVSLDLLYSVPIWYPDHVSGTDRPIYFSLGLSL